MHHADIIAAMVKAGWPSAKVAKHLKVSRGLVSKVIHGKATSRPVATFIARKTGRAISELFPNGRYTSRLNKRFDSRRAAS